MKTSCTRDRQAGLIEKVGLQLEDQIRILGGRLREEGDMRRLFDHSTIRVMARAEGLCRRLDRTDRIEVSGMVTARLRDERQET